MAMLIVGGGSTSTSIRWVEEGEEEDGKVDGRLYIVEIWWEVLLTRVKEEDAKDLGLDADAEVRFCGGFVWVGRRKLWGLQNYFHLLFADFY